MELRPTSHPELASDSLPATEQDQIETDEVEQGGEGGCSSLVGEVCHLLAGLVEAASWKGHSRHHSEHHSEHHRAQHRAHVRATHVVLRVRLMRL